MQIWFTFTAFVASVHAADCPAYRDYDKTTQAVTEKFYDKSFKGLKWSERVASHRAKLTCTDGAQAVAAAVNGLLSELKSSHTQVYTPEDLDYWALKSIFSHSLDAHKVAVSGIWAVKQEGKWFAKNVLQGSAAEAAGVLPGDELMSMDGHEFRPAGFVKRKSSRLVFTHDGRVQLQAGIEPEFESVQQAFLTATKKSAKILTVGKKKFGYFHLWCGTHDKFMAAQAQALAQFKKQKVQGVIVDYRDGFGGANPDYLKSLTNDPYFKKTSKIFLINEGVRSGKEWLSAIVQRDKIGTLVGTKTAGALVAGAPIELKDERYFLYLAVQEFNPPDIPKLEGVGVTPDVLTSGCGRYCNGVDPQLAKALELLGNISG